MTKRTFSKSNSAYSKTDIEDLEDILELEEEEEEEDEEDRGDFLIDDEDEDEDEELEESDEEEDSEDDEDEDSDEDEEDDEDLDEDDEDEDDEEDDEDEDDAKSGRVPRSRLNQVIKQREAQREKAEWLQEQLELLLKRESSEQPKEVKEAPPAFNFEEAEEQYIELILEGNTKEARSLKLKIDAERERLYEAKLDELMEKATKHAETTTKASLEEQKFEEYISHVFEEKPYLNDESDEYNEKAVKMANQLMAAYMAEGETKSSALRKAIEDISPLFEEVEKEHKAKKPVLGEKEKRSKAARKKAAEASRNQPPSARRTASSKQSRDLEDLNINKLSEKDFRSLTKKELAALRGDSL